MLKLNVPMTDDLNQIFGLNEIDYDKWIVFTTDFIKEINYTLDSRNCIEIVYNINNNDVLFFVKMIELNNLMNIINESEIPYQLEYVNNEIFLNF